MPDKDSSDKPTGLPTLSGEASWQKWWAVWKDHVFYEASLADPDKITHHAMLESFCNFSLMLLPGQTHLKR